MSLSITRVLLRDFRSYSSHEQELGDQLTILVGPNGAGKTNFVEAIQLLTTGESFRRPQWKDVVRWGADSAQVALNAEGDGRSISIEMSVKDGRREYAVNGKVRRTRSEIVGIIPCVVFTPDHLRIVKESAEARRTALDGLGTQISSSYASLKSEYERVLRQRNRLLKDGAGDEMLSPWTESLISVGVKYSESRRRLFNRVIPEIQAAHKRVSGIGDLEIEYLDSWTRDGTEPGDTTEQTFRSHLERKRYEERARGSSLAGPHRDDLVFRLDGRDARTFASQGQQRTIALSWKFAEVAVVAELSGQKPVLLLDDVMSELDDSRREALADMMGEAAQTVVTTTNPRYFDPQVLQAAKVVTLG